MSDYDKSIHSNPDAKVWAEFFNQTLVESGKQPLDVGVMIGWFANAMMAMHDHIYQTKFPEELSALKAKCEAAEADKNYWGEDQVKYLQAELTKREADLAAANSDKENLMEAGMKAAIRADRAESKLSETRAKLEEAEHELAIECDWHNDTLKKFAAQEKVVERAKEYFRLIIRDKFLPDSYAELIKAFLAEIGKL